MKRFMFAFVLISIISGCSTAEIQPINWGQGDTVEAATPVSTLIPTPIPTQSGPDRTVPREHSELSEVDELLILSDVPIPVSDDAFVLVREWTFEENPGKILFDVQGGNAFVGSCLLNDNQVTIFMIIAPPNADENVRFEIDLSTCPDIIGYQFAIQTNDPFQYNDQAFDKALARYAAEFQLIGQFQIKENIFWFDGQIFQQYVFVTFSE